MEIITKNGFRYLYPESGKFLKNGDIITDYVVLGESATAADWEEISEQEKALLEQEKENNDGADEELSYKN